MYTRRTYKFSELAIWTRFDTLRILIIITGWVLAYFLLDIKWLQIPWTPIALIGTAVAFIVGFQNNATYDRIWEARKIWGGIVNTSRSFGMFIQDMVNNEHATKKLSDKELHNEVKTLTYRHIAWMTALRHAMRAQKQWETTVNQKTNQEWGIRPPERLTTLAEDLNPYLSKEDMEDIMGKDNKQTALLYQQSHHLRRLKESGLIWEFAFLELEGVLKDLFDLQGKSERIKNFPYPRQFATLNHWFMWILLMFLPLALVPQFMEIGANLSDSYPAIGKIFIWFSIPVYTAVGWVFHTMERIGRTGDNPFEGTSNDVPISTIARGIEIDLRQNLGENKEDIPPQFEAKYNVQF
ncbi:bestrophin family protein [Ekhidna sp.]|uniref:bestrophin family protein n=1 Tax=Ekhidna sp. TaxID=2608089 RepID=UPI003BAAB20E